MHGRRWLKLVYHGWLRGSKRNDSVSKIGKITSNSVIELR